ncbi:MAG: thiamine pyrophosphate-dependent dehydrogenase E1 component subunit alpha [Gemmatimonadetes bacterium]|nr:MAG: thiamine pyrophosphate-dependent dehydrogenase E1 component subunit alpha [Gemmatimonadota bacterium]
MRRYPAYDPPEYVDWEADPELVRAYRSALEDDAEVAGLVGSFDEATLLSFYRDLLTARLHDISLKRWVRQGVISKAWLGTGEEAVTVGAVRALEPGRDVVTPMIRNAAACYLMGMPLADLFRAYLATPDGPNGGRDLHVGDPGRGVIQPISHMGTNAPVIAGVALAFKRRGEPKVALTFIGDGASRTGECHEGVNFAAVQRLPAVFVLQNNQVALGTRAAHHTVGDLRRWPDQYGLPSKVVDGNNVLAMYAATRAAVELCRGGGGPAVVVAETFRMGGHATHDEREARETFPAELFEHWGRRDPIGLYEAYLAERGVTADRLQQIEEEVTTAVEAAAEEALRSREIPVDPERALYDGVSEGGVLHGLAVRPV